MLPRYNIGVGLTNLVGGYQVEVVEHGQKDIEHAKAHQNE